MVTFTTLVIIMLRDYIREQRRESATRKALEQEATYTMEIGFDCKPVKLATNYAALKTMSDTELLRAASYLKTKESNDD